MNRAVKYLQKEFNIGEERAIVIVSEVRQLDKMDNGENLMCFYNMDELVRTDDPRLIDVWDEYEDLIAADSAEDEKLAIQKVYEVEVV